MLGNWSAMEEDESASTPNEPQQQQPQHQQQQQQQQQQRPTSSQCMMENNQHPHLANYSATTPVWNSIVDKQVVKMEATEDKNNDSGISQGHYTTSSSSPTSNESSSPANCGLSPESATYGEYRPQQLNFGYSPPNAFNKCPSPEELPKAIESPVVAQSNQQTVDMSTSNEEIALVQDLTQPSVSYSPNMQLTTAPQPNTTAPSVKAESPDVLPLQMNDLPNSTNDANRNSPDSSSDKSQHEREDIEEPGVRVPRVNSQGKVKTLKCKQCDFVAVTKLAFWDHTRCHIKAEKLLTCPKCPFVTEYKHHLEYHLRNHYGSKPFKCSECSYTCVNKSMLNSHRKSHSNVYQYRCADCSYVTKYCHSLKLHLRKYSHGPDVVLNADGSPNPLPIIDVYGTRRGPKQKTTPTKPTEQRPPVAVAAPSPQVMPQLPIVAPPLAINNGFNPMLNFNPFNPMFAGVPLAEGINPNVLAEYAQIMNINARNVHVPQNDYILHNANAPDNYCGVDLRTNNSNMATDRPSAIFQFPEPMHLANEMAGVSDDSSAAPLDLSKPDTSRSRQHQSFNDQQNGMYPGMQNNGIAELPNFQEAMPSPAIGELINGHGFEQLEESLEKVRRLNKTSGKHRRKGKAVKLSRQAIEWDTPYSTNDEDDAEASGGNGGATNDGGATGATGAGGAGFSGAAGGAGGAGDAGGAGPQQIENNENSTKEPTSDGKAGAFMCQFCQISFGNEVMYTVHMGYHGFNEPFTCNMCGHRCDDKILFFLHIARSKHQ